MNGDGRYKVKSIRYKAKTPENGNHFLGFLCGFSIYDTGSLKLRFVCGCGYFIRRRSQKFST